MDRTLDSVQNGYRLSILGDLNGWIEDRTRASITGAFGVPGQNEGCRSGCLLIFMAYGPGSKEVIKNNYYELKEISGWFHHKQKQF